MTPEARVKKRVCIVLKELGAYYATLVQASAPDFLVCWRGKFFGVECKASGGKPTALQEKNMKEIREAGGHAIAIDENNVDQLGSWVRAHEYEWRSIKS
jgi:hypothetical protein